MDEALNQMTQEALDLGAEYILLIDDDTQPPPSVINDLMRVLETSDDSVMACGGIYTTRFDPPEPVVYMGWSEGAFWNWKVGDIFPCWAVGNGCLMIRMKIFQMMPRPWFKTIKTMDEVAQYPDLFPPNDFPIKSVCVSPDLFFFKRLEQMGFKCLAHGGVLPIHHGADGKKYWLPKNTPPTQGVVLNGVEFGWVK